MEQKKYGLYEIHNVITKCTKIMEESSKTMSDNTNYIIDKLNNIWKLLDEWDRIDNTI